MQISSGRGRDVGSDSFAHLAAGTMVSSDLDAVRPFYEKFLGLECVRCAPDRMLLRDAKSRSAMERGSPRYLVIDVRQVDTISHPQNMLNHWGLSVETTEEVDRIHARAKALKDHYAIGKVMPITNMHGAYGFYFTDRDRNWWEVECRIHGMTNEMVFARGDHNTAV